MGSMIDLLIIFAASALIVGYFALAEYVYLCLKGFGLIDEGTPEFGLFVLIFWPVLVAAFAIACIYKLARKQLKKTD